MPAPAPDLLGRNLARNPLNAPVCIFMTALPARGPAHRELNLFSDRPRLYVRDLQIGEGGRLHA